jgi:lipoprotein-releasing system ATP-binding protein
MSISTLIEARGIHKTYAAKGEKDAVEVLRGVDLRIQTKERLAIIGSSGSGKSTLLHLLGGLDRPDHGDVIYGQTPLSTLNATQLARYRNQEVGFIFQFHHLLPEFSTLENVLMPTFIAAADVNETRERAQYLLDTLHLAHRVNHRPSELSGGEQQRVAIARALINRPQLLLADEPTGNLDQTNAQSVMDLLLELQSSESLTLVLVTHDPLIASQCDRICELHAGLVMESHLK